MVDVFAGLRGRVRGRLGEARPLRELDFRFGDWLQRGRRASPATVAEVETALARYLASAAGVGRAWGIAVGVVTGLLIALVIAGLALAVQVIR